MSLLLLGYKSSANSYDVLLGGFPNKSVDSDDALWTLSRDARANSVVRSIIAQNPSKTALKILSATPSATEWHEAFFRWVSEFGHCLFELDLLSPTILDDPSIAIDTIKSMCNQPNTTSPLVRLRDRAKQRIREEKLFLERLALKIWKARSEGSVIGLCTLSLGVETRYGKRL